MRTWGRRLNMNTRQIALARLAYREAETISAACELFLQYSDEFAGTPLKFPESKLAKAQAQADLLRNRLEKLLKPYEEIEVNEIY
jgi:hypothetical protein